MNYNTNYHYSDINQLINLFEKQGITDFIMVDKIPKGNLPHTHRRKSRSITHISGEKLSKSDLNNVDRFPNILEAFNRGSIGFIDAKNKLSFNENFGGTLTRDAIITVRRTARPEDFSRISNKPPQGTNAAQKAINKPEARVVEVSDKEDSREVAHKTSSHPDVNRSQRKAEPACLEEEESDRKIHAAAQEQEIHAGQEIDEGVDVGEHDNNDVELFSNFDTISQEEYDKFLYQIHKIMGIKTEDQQSSSSTPEPFQTKIMNQDIDKVKSSARRATSKKHEVIEKYTSPSYVEERREEKATEDKNRLDAAKEKDEKAGDKARRAIKADLNKAEIKETQRHQALIMDNEINESALLKMVKDGEISEDAMNELLECANIDEKFLMHMFNERTINEQAYNKFIMAINEW